MSTQQIVYNPRTNEVRYVDISQGTGEIAKLYQQGWQPGQPANPSRITNIPVLGAQPPTPQPAASATLSKAPKAPATQRAPYKWTPPDVSKPVTKIEVAPVSTPKLSASLHHSPTPLEAYTKNSMVDLQAVMWSGDQKAIKEAKQLYPEQARLAELAIKVPATAEQYERMGPDAKKRIRIVKPVSLTEWNAALGREDTEYLLTHYPEAKGVSESSAANLGSGVLGRTAYIQPTMLENLTYWDESKNESPTIAGFANHVADYVVPFKDLSQNWEHLSNVDRGLYLFLDLTFVGAIAGKPALKVTSKVTANLLKNVATKDIRKSLTTAYSKVSLAVIARDASQIKRAGSDLKVLASKLEAPMSTTLTRQGNILQRNAESIAKGTYKGSGVIKRLTKETKQFIKDQRGVLSPQLQRIPENKRALKPFKEKTLQEQLALQKIEQMYKQAQKQQLKQLFEVSEKQWAKIAVPVSKAIDVKVEKQSATILKQALKALQQNRVKLGLMTGTSFERALQTLLKLGTAVAIDTATKTKSKVAIQQAVETAIKTELATITDTELKTALKTQTETLTATATATATKLATLTKTKTMTATEIATAVKTMTLPVTQTLTKTKTQTQTKTQPLTRTKTKTATKQKKNKTDDDIALKVEKVRGISGDPGIVSFNSGIVKVTITPPYRTSDISYKRLDKPETGEGSQERTLKVTQGEAPEEVILSRGIDLISIQKGKRMTHSRVATQSSGSISKGGKAVTQRAGTVI